MEAGSGVVGLGLSASPTLVPLQAVVHVEVDASVSLCHDGSGEAPASLSTLQSDCIGESSLASAFRACW